jgi:hypothetical protein
VVFFALPRWSFKQIGTVAMPSRSETVDSGCFIRRVINEPHGREGCDAVGHKTFAVLVATLDA